MPIADSSAPIVVGARQTRSPTSTMIDCLAFEYTAKGCSVATARMKISVSPARRMFSAISFGVF